MTEKQRGIIDCLEFTNSDEELRLIDYKKNKNETDLETLYFYAILLEEFMWEKNWEDLFLKEVGCYYYSTGELMVEKFNIDSKNKMEEKIQDSLEEIKNGNFEFNHRSCNNCNFKIVCEIERMRQ